MTSTAIRATSAERRVGIPRSSSIPHLLSSIPMGDRAALVVACAATDIRALSGESAISKNPQTSPKPAESGPDIPPLPAGQTEPFPRRETVRARKNARTNVETPLSAVNHPSALDEAWIMRGLGEGRLALGTSRGRARLALGLLLALALLASLLPAPSG